MADTFLVCTYCTRCSCQQHLLPRLIIRTQSHKKNTFFFSFITFCLSRPPSLVSHLYSFLVTISHSAVFILLSAGGAGRSFNPGGLREAELLEHPCCGLPVSAADPPHPSFPVLPRLAAGWSVQGARPLVRPGALIPAVVSRRARSGSPAGLEQDRRLWPGGLGPHLRNG